MYVARLSERKSVEGCVRFYEPAVLLRCQLSEHVFTGHDQPVEPGRQLHQAERAGRRSGTREGRQIIWAQVVPVLDRVLITMSPGR